MTKTFGKRQAGSKQPQTQSTLRTDEGGTSGNALKLLFGALAAVAIALFVYNSYFSKPASAPTQSVTAPPSTITGTETVSQTARTADLQVPMYPELDHYLQAHHVNPVEAQLNKYARTTTLLAICGPSFAAVRRDYQRQNHPLFVQLRGQDPAGLDLENLPAVPPDIGFSRAVSPRECSYVSQVVRLGQQDL